MGMNLWRSTQVGEQRRGGRAERVVNQVGRSMEDTALDLNKQLCSTGCNVSVVTSWIGTVLAFVSKRNAVGK